MNIATALTVPPCAKRGEVAPSYGNGGVIGRTDAVAHDPSVADYRATSPASPGRKEESGRGMSNAIGLTVPPCARRGEVAPSYGDGGVIGRSLGGAYDPSVADYRATSPASPGRKEESGRAMSNAIDLTVPPCAQRGEVAPSYGDGGVMSHRLGGAYDPSVADYRATSPVSPGRKAL